MDLKVYIDGKFYKREEAKVSVFDHGLLYGDGVFEGIRSYRSRVFKLDEHLERLFLSAKAIMLNIPLSKQELKDAVIETMKLNNIKDGYVRLVVTRGTGGLGLDPDKCLKGSVIIIADSIALYPEKFYKEGLEVATVPTRRNIIEALNPRIKSLNYLNNVLAKIEAKIAGTMEAIMLNNDGYVVECTADNIFIIDKKTLITPPVSIGALKGITRDAVIQIAGKMKIEVREQVFTRYELFTANECFLTGTAAEIIPVVKVDRRPIGEGRPGPVTLELIKRYKELTKTQGVPIY